MPLCQIKKKRIFFLFKDERHKREKRKEKKIKDSKNDSKNNKNETEFSSMMQLLKEEEANGENNKRTNYVKENIALKLELKNLQKEFDFIVEEKKNLEKENVKYAELLLEEKTKNENLLKQLGHAESFR